jgi:hypothetical protein
LGRESFSSVIGIDRLKTGRGSVLPATWGFEPEGIRGCPVRCNMAPGCAGLHGVDTGQAPSSQDIAQAPADACQTFGQTLAVKLHSSPEPARS